MSQPSGAYHLPVLRDTVIDSLGLAPGKRALDATLGGGGHALALASAISPGGVLIGLDRDIDALRAGAARLASVEDVRVHLHHATYDQIDSALDGAGVDAVDAILMDLGVSSYQLDTAARGFAIRYVGPLDMRMDQSVGETAAQLLNRLPEAEIADLLFRFGEEPRARRIAYEIVRARPLTTTEDLVDCVRRAMPFRTRPGEIHPATKVFQAVRIAVNSELSILESALKNAVNRLAVGGRIAVIAYHSLEDRIVKNVFAELSGKRIGNDLPILEPDAPAILSLVTKKPIAPDDREIRENPRARSARLRVAERCES